MKKKNKPSNPVEMIYAGDDLHAIVIRRHYNPKITSFLTPTDCSLQTGHIVYPKNARIPAHMHLPIRRTIVGTPEFILVQKGACTVEIYTTHKKLLAKRDLLEQDSVLLLRGGHAFTINKKSLLLEIKQGPYAGQNEKRKI